MAGMRYIVLGLCMVLLIIPTASALFKTREYNPDQEKVIVADWFGVSDWFDMYSVELVSNTDYCFDCETVYKVCNLKGSELSLDDFMVKFYKDQEISFDSDLEYLYKEHYTETVDITEETTEFDKLLNPIVTSKVTGKKEIERTRTEWRSFDPSAFKMLAVDGCLDLRVNGHLSPNDAVDNRINLAGVEVAEFSWWNSSLPYRVQFNSTNNAGAQLDDFPVLINVSGSFSFDQSDYGDIRILNASCGTDGTELAYEIENSTATRALLWVKVPTYATGINEFCMYYGVADAEDGEDPNEVWTNGFYSVLHFNNNDWIDSTGNMTYDSPTQPNATQGVVGNAYQGGAGTWINGTGTAWNYAGNVSVEWILPYFNYRGARDYVWSFTPTNVYARTDDGGGGKLDMDTHFSGEWHIFTDVNNETPQYYGVSVEASQSNTDRYINGSLVSANVAQNDIEASTKFYVGVLQNEDAQWSWQDQIDEFRLSVVHRTPEYYNATFETMFYNDYVTAFGTEETSETPNEIPTVTTPAIAPTPAYSTSKLNCTTTPTDAENETMFVDFAWWLNYNNNGLTYNNTVPAQNNTKVGSAQNITEQLFVGHNWTCAVRAWDGENYSAWSNVTVRINSTTPTWTQDPPNISQFHTVDISMDVNASDVDPNEQLQYFINDTRFNISNNTGVISGNMDPAWAGNWSFVVNATDDWGLAVNQTMNVELYSPDYAPVMNSSRISPILPNESTDLIGFCNATHAGTEKITYEFRWRNGSQIYSEGSSYIYQESANPVYAQASWTNPLNINDTDWSTAISRVSSSSGYVFLNYSITDGYYSYIWIGKNSSQDIFNLTLPSACINGSLAQLGYWSFGGIGATNRLACWNNGWINLTNQTGTIFYEEGLYMYHDSGEFNVNNLSSALTAKGDSWMLECRAYDGGNYSAWLNSSAVSVESSPPALDVNITTDDGLLNGTFANITVGYNCSDADGDTCDTFQQYQWFNDTGLISGQSSATLNSTHTFKHDNITAEVTIEDDGGGLSNRTAQNITITILNTAPAVNTVAIGSPLYTHQSATCTPTSTDPDGDTVSYHYQWFNDTGVIAGEVSNTLTNSFYTTNHNLTCEVTPDDLDINGTAVNSSAVKVLASTGLNITVKDEETNAVITWRNVSLEFYSNNHATNTSTVNGLAFVTNTTQDEYEIRYYAEDYSYRYYYINASSVNTNLTLYLLNESSGTRIFATVEDESGEAVPDVLIKAQRQYIDCNCFRNVEMQKTDFQGEGSFTLVLNDIPYKFVLERNDTTLQTTEARKISSITIFFTVQLLENILESIRWTWDFATSMRFINSTSEIEFTYNDATGARLEKACLNVTRKTALADFDVCQNCSTLSGTTMLCKIDTTKTGTWFATGSIDTTTNHSTYIMETLVVDASSAHLTYGNMGLFMTMFFVLVFGLIGYFFPAVGIVLAVLGVGLGALMGFAYISYSSFIVLAFIAIVIIIKVSK